MHLKAQVLNYKKKKLFPLKCKEIKNALKSFFENFSLSNKSILNLEQSNYDAIGNVFKKKDIIYT